MAGAEGKRRRKYRYAAARKSVVLGAAERRTRRRGGAARARRLCRAASRRSALLRSCRGALAKQRGPCPLEACSTPAAKAAVAYRLLWIHTTAEEPGQARGGGGCMQCLRKKEPIGMAREAQRQSKGPGAGQRQGRKDANRQEHERRTHKTTKPRRGMRAGGRRAGGRAAHTAAAADCDYACWRFVFGNRGFARSLAGGGGTCNLVKRL